MAQEKTIIKGLSLLTASLGLAAGLAGQAQAQVRFGFDFGPYPAGPRRHWREPFAPGPVYQEDDRENDYVVSPREIARILADEGFRPIERPRLWRGRIVAIGESRSGAVRRFVIHAYSGALLEMTPIGAQTYGDGERDFARSAPYRQDFARSKPYGEDFARPERFGEEERAAPPALSREKSAPKRKIPNAAVNDKNGGQKTPRKPAPNPGVNSQPSQPPQSPAQNVPPSAALPNDIGPQVRRVSPPPASGAMREPEKTEPPAPSDSPPTASLDPQTMTPPPFRANP